MLSSLKVDESAVKPISELTPDSQWIIQQLDDQMTRCLNMKSEDSKDKNKRAVLDKALNQLNSAEFYIPSKQITRSRERLDENINNHYEAFRDNVFISNNIAFPKDQNLISKNVRNPNKISQYFEYFQELKKNDISNKTAKEIIDDIPIQKLDSNLIDKTRIHTSGGMRSTKNFENKYFANNRCRTAINSRYNLQK